MLTVTRIQHRMEVDVAAPRRCLATTLPVELLTMVFESETEPARLMELALVCRSWKNIILSEPVLWRFIRVWAGSTDKQLSLSLARTARCDLSVKIILHPPIDDLQLIGRIAAVMNQRLRIADMDVHLDWTDENSDPDAEFLWPTALVDSFGGSLDWPRLRRLHITGSPEPGNSLVLDMVCPRLADLELTCVDPRHHDWRRIAAGDSLRRISLDECFLGPRFFTALCHYPNLRELSLHSQAATTFPQERLDASFTFTHLSQLSWDWTVVDVALFLAVLSMAPNLDCVIVKVDRFDPLDGPAGHARGLDLALPSLREFNLGVDEPGGCGDVMRYLSLKDRAPKLRCLTLSGVSLFPAQSLPSQLGKINLARLSVTPSELRRQLCKCAQLDALIFQQLLVEAEDSDLAEEQRLPHLLSASLTGIRPGDDLVPAEDVSPANQRMLDFMLSLLPKGPMAPFVSVSVFAIRLDAEDVGTILSPNCLDHPLSLVLMEPGDGFGTEMKLMMHAVVASRGRRHTATAHNLRINSTHETLRMLNIGIRLFPRLLVLSVHASLLTTVLAVPRVDELPALHYLQINFSDDLQASRFPAVCGSIRQRVSCPVLEIVYFNGVSRSGPLFVRITSAVRDIFGSRLRSGHKIKFEAGGDPQIVLVDEESLSAENSL